MEYDWTAMSFKLQPNEVLETGEVRITNLSKEAKSVSWESLSYFDRIKLSGGPNIENGLEFRLRAA